MTQTIVFLVASLLVSVTGAAAQSGGIDTKLAAQYFRQLKETSDRDGGKMWSVPLYGPIMFVDPRPRAHMNRVPNQTTEITFVPQPGMLIMFPSYYEHAVIPFRGPGVRICIAFNANV